MYKESTALGSKDKLKALVVKTDGTAEEVIVSEIDGTKVTDPDGEAAGIIGGLYTYKISSGEYKLTKVVKTQTSYDYFASLKSFDGDNTVTLNNAYKKETGDKDVAVTSARIDNNAVIFVDSTEDSEVKVISGSALKAWKDQTWNISGVALIDGTTGYKYIKVATIKLGAVSIPGASSDTMYGYITSDVEAIDTEDGTKYTFTVWNGTDSETVTTTDNTDLAKDVFISYEYDGDDIDVLDEYTITDDADYVQGVDGNEVMIGGVSYDMDDDETKVIFVRTKSHEGATGSLKEADKNTAGKYYKNVIPVIDDGALVALFVDASNKMYVNDEAVVTA